MSFTGSFEVQLRDRTSSATVQIALSLLAASGGLLYYYLNKEDRDRNRNYGALLAGHACARRTAVAQAGMLSKQ